MGAAPSPARHVLPTAHDMTREHHRARRATRHRRPVPPLAFCDDESVNDAPFYVMEKVDGDILRSPAELRAIARRGRRCSEVLVDVLVAIHAVDYPRVGLDDFGHPDGYVERQVRRWGEQWERSKSRELPAIEELARSAARRAAGVAPAHDRPRRLPPRQHDARARRPGCRRGARLGDGDTRRSAPDLGLFLVYWPELRRRHDRPRPAGEPGARVSNPRGAGGHAMPSAPAATSLNSTSSSPSATGSWRSSSRASTPATPPASTARSTRESTELRPHGGAPGRGGGRGGAARLTLRVPARLTAAPADLTRVQLERSLGGGRLSPQSLVLSPASTKEISCNQIRKRLTYANVMSSLAVFLVLGGATAFAALSKNSVGSKRAQSERGYHAQDEEKRNHHGKDQGRRGDRSQGQRVLDAWRGAPTRPTRRMPPTSTSTSRSESSLRTMVNRRYSSRMGRSR